MNLFVHSRLCLLVCMLVSLFCFLCLFVCFLGFFFSLSLGCSTKMMSLHIHTTRQLQI